MLRKLSLLLIPLVVSGLACVSPAKEVIDLGEAKADPDFAIQGEYVGEGKLLNGSTDKVGAQVIALGKGEFRAVVYKGGLPGDGWKRGDEKFALEGKADELKGRKLTGKIAEGKLTISDGEGNEKISLKRIERTSPTLEAKAPQGAVVLFDGSNADAFEGHIEMKDKALVSGFTTKQKFEDYTLHLEFRLSWMPEARGQGRSNSGIYPHDAYEMQVLDSFGLEGANNECGGFYSVKAPDVNMCCPPMTWQTYDIELKAPKYRDGNKVENARITVRHNGVAIHDNLELPRGTPGRQPEGPGPRPIHFQGHGNKVLYRNIWLVEKK